MIRASGLKQICNEADVITLFCKLTPETRGMINKHSISFMKPTAYIVNTARGAIINESDLIEALQQKRIAGAALDTFEIEPPEKHNPLYSLENVILTSHVGGASKNAMRNMGIGAVNNVLSVLTDGLVDPGCVLNKEIRNKIKYKQ